MPAVWFRTTLQHAAVLAAGLLVGWLYGSPTSGLLGAVSVLLGWHLYHLFLLEKWLRTGEHGPLPAGNGPWSQVLARVEATRERARANRRNWVSLVKELRASTKAFPDGGVVLNADNEIVRANKAARRLLGLKKKRDRGMRVDSLIRHPAFVEYLDHGQFKESVEIPSPADSDKWLTCRLIPYGMAQHLLLVRDITQSVEMIRMRRDFVANASHELRSPLTVIAGYLDVMGDDEKLPDAWRAPVADMREQAERMSNLVRDLLQLSKLESSDSCSREHVVDIAAILSSAQREAMSLSNSHVTRDVHLDMQSKAGLLGEETDIQSVVSNLVTNALRYTPEDGSIRISWQVDDQGGHLAVVDSGIGVREEDIPRLTERFYRTDAGRAHQKSGTGLGLAIVKHALKRHDAELEIRSELGAGSEFVCHFPKDRLTAA
jgi:two-component system phosphate regulon sensor histidine kinase PhoR